MADENNPNDETFVDGEIAEIGPREGDTPPLDVDKIAADVSAEPEITESESETTNLISVVANGPVIGGKSEEYVLFYLNKPVDITGESVRNIRFSDIATCGITKDFFRSDSYNVMGAVNSKGILGNYRFSGFTEKDFIDINTKNFEITGFRVPKFAAKTRDHIPHDFGAPDYPNRRTKDRILVYSIPLLIGSVVISGLYYVLHDTPNLFYKTADAGIESILEEKNVSIPVPVPVPIPAPISIARVDDGVSQEIVRPVVRTHVDGGVLSSDAGKLSVPFLFVSTGRIIDDLEIFRYKNPLTSRDNPGIIADTFNNDDDNNGDLYQKVGYLNIVDATGERYVRKEGKVKSSFSPKKIVFVAARKKLSATSRDGGVVSSKTEQVDGGMSNVIGSDTSLSPDAGNIPTIEYDVGLPFRTAEIDPIIENYKSSLLNYRRTNKINGRAIVDYAVDYDGTIHILRFNSDSLNKGGLYKKGLEDLLNGRSVFALPGIYRVGL